MPFIFQSLQRLFEDKLELLREKEDEIGCEQNAVLKSERSYLVSLWCFILYFVFSLILDEGVMNI